MNVRIRIKGGSDAKRCKFVLHRQESLNEAKVFMNGLVFWALMGLLRCEYMVLLRLMQQSEEIIKNCCEKGNCDDNMCGNYR